MTLRHLKIFHEAARTGNFTRAAENLYLTQSAVSRAIGELEKEAGTQLFERLSKNIQLTGSGKLLLEEVTPLLSACDNLEKRMTGLEKEAPLHIVSSITIAIYYLPEIIKQFENLWHGVEVHTEVVSAACAMELLKSGKADVALVEGIEVQEPYCGHVFACCRLKAVCAGGYSAAGKHMDIPGFCKEKLLLREKGSAIRDLLDSALYLKGYEVSPIWTSVNSTALLSAAKAGLGIAVLPDMMADEEIKRGTLEEVKVEGLELTNNMTAIWHRDKYFSAPLKDFAELAAGRKGEAPCGENHFSH